MLVVTMLINRLLIAGGSTAVLAAALLLGGCAYIPEAGMLFDLGEANRTVVIRLSEQRAYLYRDGDVVAISPVSTGREGYRTPIGRFRVIQKERHHRSTLYGVYVKKGHVVAANVDIRKTRRPPGAKFVGAPMPYFLRIKGAYGIHAGHVPGYPASHGCIRLPLRYARWFYYAADLGTPVFIYR